ncbi:MAG: hypothetical protein U1F67_10195 [Rubrivivax sp.]
MGDVVLGAIEVFTGRGSGVSGGLKGQAAGWIAEQVLQKVDGQVEAGLYALDPATLDKLKGSGQRVATLPAAAAAAGPVLVLVHGTFVDTSSTFTKLWTEHPARVRELFARYGNRVFGLDHPTMGASPIANALTLVQALPRGQPVRLHLLTHSRGGLVAEVLARMAHQKNVGAADSRSSPVMHSPVGGANCRSWRAKWPRATSASSASCAWPARRAARCWRASGSMRICRCCAGRCSSRMCRWRRRSWTCSPRWRAAAPTRR